MNKLFPLAGALALALGAVLFWPTSNSGSLTAFGAAEAQEGEVDTSIVKEMTQGDPDAPVTVIEYASATCPHCANFHKNVYPQLKENYIDTGKIEFVYREVYFDRFGLWAGMLARCGMPRGDDADEAEMETAEKRYFGLMSIMFDQQKQWLDAESPAGIAENLSKIGRTAGLSAEQVDACLQDAEMAQALVQVFQENAEADEINSTPSFIINGEKYSNMPYDEFAETLDGMLDN
ncbi:DsbA family protein [Psychromarinibacter sp. C21-152]|uniref:DsbA family protein n=1 Tax=Psychromarinibacter sediminicola TaxID=3033385 RepID=A0AAE3NUR1_9RHOB|nr:DsbA family protein [Psychromarinibacter sediminicola]MDF0602472.1 DsbA family protein [Psychromarinibacter sediminicola]